MREQEIPIVGTQHRHYIEIEGMDLAQPVDVGGDFLFKEASRSSGQSLDRGVDATRYQLG